MDKTKKEIPVSIIIADTQAQINSIINNSPLPPCILELICKSAWQTTALRAQTNLEMDCKIVNSNISNDNKESEEKE